MEAAPDRQQRPKVSIYLESRYRKLERGLPQTVFYCPDCKGHRRRRMGCERCDGYGKLSRDSVQELIGRKVLPTYRARDGKFHGAGREDVDVRMLGRGRPFVFEVVAPRAFDVDLDALVKRINEDCAGRIEIDPFQEVARERVVAWKEAKCDKIYRAEVALDATLVGRVLAELPGRDLEVVQRTPPRVAHRRADLERRRRVSIQHVEAKGSDRLVIEMQCSHGTYVKEWISGDDGRTTPSLSELIDVVCRCDSLDVLEILTD